MVYSNSPNNKLLSYQVVKFIKNQQQMGVKFSKHPFFKFEVANQPHKFKNSAIITLYSKLNGSKSIKFSKLIDFSCTQ